MPFTYIRRAGIALALFAVAGCTVKSTEAPPLAGPSGLAISLNVKASPDNINQDGASQSAVKVTAIGPDGRPFAALPLRLDMFVGGVAQDYGTLSARSVVTNSDGEATAVYTAPPSPVNGLFGTCSGLPGNCVSIVATATSNEFQECESGTGRHSPGSDRRHSAARIEPDGGSLRIRRHQSTSTSRDLRRVHEYAW